MNEIKINLKETITTDLAKVDLKEDKAKQITDLYIPMLDQLNQYEEEFNQIVSQTITPTVVNNAKNLRLRIAKTRTTADKARKTAKEEFMLAANAIQGAYNTLKFAVNSKEETLKDIEKHFEIQEAARLAKVQEVRAAELEALEVAVIPQDLGYMADETWNNFLTGTKLNFENKKKAEAQALADKEKEKALVKLKRDRNQKLAPLFDFVEPIKKDGVSIPVEEWTTDQFAKTLENAEIKKAAKQAEDERIRKENAKLKEEKDALVAEQAKKEELRLKEAAKEKAKLEQKQKEEKEKADLLRKKEEEKVAKEKAVLQAKIDKEAKEKAALQKQVEENKAKEDKAKAEKLAKAKAALTAPDKEKIIKLKEDFQNIIIPAVNSEEAKKIIAGIETSMGKVDKWLEAKIKTL